MASLLSWSCISNFLSSCIKPLYRLLWCPVYSRPGRSNRAWAAALKKGEGEGCGTTPEIAPPRTSVAADLGCGLHLHCPQGRQAQRKFGPQGPQGKQLGALGVHVDRCHPFSKEATRPANDGRLDCCDGGAAGDVLTLRVDRGAGEQLLAQEAERRSHLSLSQARNALQSACRTFRS